METIVAIELVPKTGGVLTPQEMLEDFADVMPGWCYLEEESQHYAATRGRKACLLRYHSGNGLGVADLGFVAARQDAHALRLVVVEAADGAVLSDAQRQQVATHFLDALDRYANGRATGIAVHALTALPA